MCVCVCVCRGGGVGGRLCPPSDCLPFVPDAIIFVSSGKRYLFLKKSVSI